MLIRTASFPGTRPTYDTPKPAEKRPDKPLRIELLEFCAEKGVRYREFERTVGYPDLFRRLEEGLTLKPNTIAKFRDVMREWGK